MADNSLQKHKNGKWLIYIYNPTDSKIGPFTGRLEISKDFHLIYDDDDNTKVTVPSQNVSYCVNTLFSE